MTQLPRHVLRVFGGRGLARSGVKGEPQIDTDGTDEARQAIR